MTGPIVEFNPLTARRAPLMRTGAEMRGSEDTTGRVPSCLLDVVLPSLTAGGRVLLAGPHQDNVALRLAKAGFRVTLQLRGVADADAASSRLPSSIDIRCGTLVGTTDTFDAVIALGGLGYLSTGDAPDNDCAEALDLLCALVAPSGLLAAVVRNGFGLDRLSSSGSDSDFHRTDCFAASRHEIGRYLSGFTAAVEFGLYPDAAAPEIAVPASAYDVGGALVATLVADSYRAAVPDRHTVCDPRRLARESVAHGLGLALAPGWLIVARRGDAGDSRPPSAVLVTDARRDDFRSVPYLLELAADGSWSRSRLTDGLADPETHGGVVRNAAALDGPIGSGLLLEERLVTAAGTHDLVAIRAQIQRYANWLGVATDDRSVDCPSDRAFAMTDNVIDDGADFQPLDPSWSSAASVRADVVFVASMYRFADRLLAGALPHPWVSAQAPAKLAARLASMAGLDVSVDAIEAAVAYADEAASVLDGRGIEEIERVVEPVIPRGATAPVVIVGPVGPVRPAARPAGLAEAMRTIDAISDEIAANHEQIALLTNSIADLDKRLAKSRRELSRLKASRLYRLVKWIAGSARAIRNIGKGKRA